MGVSAINADDGGSPLMRRRARAPPRMHQSRRCSLRYVLVGPTNVILRERSDRRTYCILRSGPARTSALIRPTSAALRRATEQQQAALASERAQRMASDSALRQELQQELGNVRGDVVALRNELQSMRTDLNAKITAMQDGLHFDMPVNFAFNDA